MTNPFDNVPLCDNNGVHVIEPSNGAIVRLVDADCLVEIRGWYGVQSARVMLVTGADYAPHRMHYTDADAQAIADWMNERKAWLAKMGYVGDRHHG